MSWRPEGWENPYQKTLNDLEKRMAASPGYVGSIQSDLKGFVKAYESGADAILQALREIGYYS